MGGKAAMFKYSFPPAVGPGCTVLVLGSLPGEASLQAVQYYAHPRNAFWGIMGRLCGFSPELPYEERLRLLNEAGIALWDVVGAGKRTGSLDAHIREERPNDIPALLRECPGIRAVFCNGGAAYRYLKRYFPDLFSGARFESIAQLPSTSPAAAMWSFEEKLRAYEAALSPLVGRRGSV